MCDNKNSFACALYPNLCRKRISHRTCMYMVYIHDICIFLLAVSNENVSKTFDTCINRELNSSLSIVNVK